MDDKIQLNTMPTAVSFETNKPTITPPQKALLLLLKEKIETSTPITREDIIDIYIKEVLKEETYQHSYIWKGGSYILDPNPQVKKWRDHWNIRSKSFGWFKNNLGAVITKGKILIIPIIESE